MSFQKIKTWDNRTSGKLLSHGKTWTKRMQWLEDEHDNVKIKFEESPLVGPKVYKEVLVPQGLAQTVWDRYKQGQSINDAISIIGQDVPKNMQSRRAGENNAS